MNTEKGSTAVEPITIPVAAAVVTGDETAPVKPKKPRGGATGDPFAAIPFPEVRAFFMIESAFEGLDDGAKRRLAGIVADKYGPPPPVLLPGNAFDRAGSARSGTES